MEPRSIVGRWKIVTNHSLPLEQHHFVPAATHVRGSLGVDISEFLRQGTNVITVDVLTSGTDGGLLNPLYLAGYSAT